MRGSVEVISAIGTEQKKKKVYGGGVPQWLEAESEMQKFLELPYYVNSNVFLAFFHPL